MKHALIYLGLVLSLVACLAENGIDPPDAGVDNGIVTTPKAARPDVDVEASLGGGECTSEEAERGTCGSRGGGGGGNCIPGDVGCHGPVQCAGVGFRWNNVTRRCEYDRVGEDCSYDPGDRCIRDILGYCQCLFPEGPLLTAPRP